MRIMSGAAQLFNQVNARKIYGEEDVMQGVFDNKLFVYILSAELALQVGPLTTPSPRAIPHLDALCDCCCIDLMYAATESFG